MRLALETLGALESLALLPHQDTDRFLITEGRDTELVVARIALSGINKMDLSGIKQGRLELLSRYIIPDEDEAGRYEIQNCRGEATRPGPHSGNSLGIYVQSFTELSPVRTGLPDGSIPIVHLALLK